MINYLLPLIYFLTVLIDAGVNSYLIEKKNRKINHKIEALIYLLVSVAISVPLKFYFHVHWGWLASFAILTRLTFFDPLLLLFRKLPFEYEGGEKPENQKSLYDRLEKIFGIDIIWLRLIYLILYLCNLIVFLK